MEVGFGGDDDDESLMEQVAKAVVPADQISRIEQTYFTAGARLTASTLISQLHGAIPFSRSQVLAPWRFVTNLLESLRMIIGAVQAAA